ncbi:MAG: hypothetical protein ACXVPU_02970 [Bacteroidia bacterium]
MNLSLKKIKTGFYLFVLAAFFAGNVSAQCASVVKDGIKKLTVYSNTGQTNNATIQSGNKVEMHLDFYKGLNYKLQFAVDKALGQCTFRILDANGTELYKYDNSNQADYFTFFSNSSQELTIEISAQDATKKGCVAVVVGMQQPKSNSIRNL